MSSLFSLTREKLAGHFLQIGQSKFRAEQVFDWVYRKGIYDISQMSNLSLPLRQELCSIFDTALPHEVKRQESKDGTVKFLFELEDHSKVESVLMRYDYGNVICLSSQVGCAMGCAFCASGLLKKERNLTAGEMIGQVLAVKEYLKPSFETLSHAVVMGTGEPFDNYDNVMDFVRILNDPKGIGMGARHITVSTCGIPDKIRRYGKEGLQINLAISLHAPNQEIRESLMPIARAYPLDELIPAVKDYIESSGRRVTFEYILLEGVNDSLQNADELSDLVRGMLAYVNLIPYNPVKEKPYRRSSKDKVKAFHDRLLKRGINATVRKEFGKDIDAACGQLRAKEKKVL